MIWHACYREYRTDAYTPHIDQKDIAAAATVFLEQSAHRLANMVAQWIRVGFAQYVLASFFFVGVFAQLSVSLDHDF
jgi:lauroyl/myristoyl acyltransferase